MFSCNFLQILTVLKFLRNLKPTHNHKTLCKFLKNKKNKIFLEFFNYFFCKNSRGKNKTALCSDWFVENQSLLWKRTCKPANSFRRRSNIYSRKMEVKKSILQICSLWLLIRINCFDLTFIWIIWKKKHNLLWLWKLLNVTSNSTRCSFEGKKHFSIRNHVQFVQIYTFYTTRHIPT